MSKNSKSTPRPAPKNGTSNSGQIITEKRGMVTVAQIPVVAPPAKPQGSNTGKTFTNVKPNVKPTISKKD